MTTFVLAALAAAIVGIVAFTVILSGSLTASVDSSLQATTTALIADIRSGTLVRDEPAPRIDPGVRHRYFAQVAAVFDPAGRLVEAEPLVLPQRLNTETVGRTYRDQRYGGDPFRFLTQPVATSSGRWIVVVGQNLRSTEEAKGDARDALYIVVPIGLFLSGLGAWLLSGAALRPVDRMRADAARLSETGEAGNVSVPATSDSVHELAQTFNTLLDRLHTSLERQRSLVADAGHELRTPLAVLQTELDTAVRPNRTRDDLIDSITHARHEVARLATLSENLLLLAQADGAGPLIRTDLTDVGELVAITCAAHVERFAASQIELVVRTDVSFGPAVADVDPIAVRRILDNLLANARRHTLAGGQVELLTSIVGSGSCRTLTIVVQDSGSGFPPEFLLHAFKRFSRADKSRSRSAAGGTGLGLAIVETLVAAHGGRATARNADGGGARVEVSFPLRDIDDPRAAHFD